MDAEIYAFCLSPIYMYNVDLTLFDGSSDQEWREKRVIN